MMMQFKTLSMGHSIGQPIVAMHIPDGFLNVPVMLVAWVFAIALIALSLKKVEADYQDRAVPLMGVCAAFIFAAQMINFPIPGGTSGHLLGGTLAGVLLGPWAGSLVMSIVFMVQALIFQDGGILALGANILNMGLIGTFGGYYLFRTVRNFVDRQQSGHQFKGLVVGTAIAAWLSVVMASALVALQLAISGTVPLAVGLTAMVGWHVMIGLGEALVTVSTVTFIWRSRPDLLYTTARKNNAVMTRSASR
jgi:cobalt/nickel transport system permease protein